MHLKQIQLKKSWERKQRGQKGLSLIEASMVLALSAVVVAGVMMYYQGAAENNRVKDAQAELGAIQATMNNLSGGTSDYNGIGSAQLVKSKGIPNSFKSGSNIVSPFGSASVSGATNSYTVTFNDVPSSACLSLGSGIFKAGTAKSMKIGNTEVTSLDTIANKCGTDSKAKMVWVFNS
jgi:major structural subunit of bundle-forming pilus